METWIVPRPRREEAAAKLGPDSAVPYPGPTTRGPAPAPPTSPLNTRAEPGDSSYPYNYYPPPAPTKPAAAAAAPTPRSGDAILSTCPPPRLASPRQRRAGVTPRGHLLPPAQSGGAHGDTTPAGRRAGREELCFFSRGAERRGRVVAVESVSSSGPARGLLQHLFQLGTAIGSLGGWMKAESRAQRRCFAPYALAPYLSGHGCLDACPHPLTRGSTPARHGLGDAPTGMRQSTELTPKSSFGSRFLAF